MNGAKTFFARMSLCAACACTATLYRLVQRGSALRSPTFRYLLTLLTRCGGFDVPSMIQGTMQRPTRGMVLRRFQFGWSIHILPTCRSLARCRMCQNTFNIIFSCSTQFASLLRNRKSLSRGTIQSTRDLDHTPTAFTKHRDRNHQSIQPDRRTTFILCSSDILRCFGTPSPFRQARTSVRT